MEFRNKTIWIISPERWGILKVSKHHYAVELVKMNNRVFFIEPPDLFKTRSGEIHVTGEGVHILSYKPWARGKRFIGKKLFSFLQKRQFRKIIRRCAMPPDIIWCFDDGNFDDLRIFNALLIVFHAVDHNLERKTPSCATTADIIFATSPKILAYMKPAGKPGAVINHGLSEAFVQYAETRKSLLLQKDSFAKFNNMVGFWGSLFKESLDRKKITCLIDSYPAIKFIFFGPYEMNQNNLGGTTNNETLDFISTLKNRSNVLLKGSYNSSDLINEIDGIDLFINIEFEYSVRWDNGNPHKVLEYLATGKPIFTTPMVMYPNSDLFFFHRGKYVDEDFGTMINQWETLNEKHEQLRRINFALANTYVCQIKKIENILASENFT